MTTKTKKRPGDDPETHPAGFGAGMSPEDEALARAKQFRIQDEQDRILKARAVSMLIEGAKMTQVAKELGIGPQKVGDWKDDEEFMQMLRDAGDGVIEAVINESVENVILRIKTLGEKALNNVEASLESDDERVRLQASQMVFRIGDFMSRDMNVTIGLEQQLAALSAGSPATGD